MSGGKERIDVIAVLSKDAETIRELFKLHARALLENDKEEQDRLSREIQRHAIAHSYAEKKSLFPNIGSLLPEEADVEAIKERCVHDLNRCERHLVKLNSISPLEGQTYEQEMERLRECLESYFLDEEDILFPKMRKQADEAFLHSLAASILNEKHRAPHVLEVSPMKLG
eukprot:tig00021123_g18513.t1